MPLRCPNMQGKALAQGQCTPVMIESMRHDARRQASPLAAQRESRHDAPAPSQRTAMPYRLSILALCVASHAALAAEPSPREPAPPNASQAGDRCEQAVAETVSRMRGRDAKEVSFIVSRRVITPATEGQDLGVRGEGRYRASAAGTAVSFTYRCAFDLGTGATSGVLFREALATSAHGEPAWEPDLSRMSPEACEAAAATHLKQKYPRVGRIAFGSDSRRLRPAPNERTSLEGHGALQRAPGMNLVPFTYRCEFDGASGEPVSVQTTE